MATPQENAAAIVAHAATLDTMIASFRTIKADIEVREDELRKLKPGQPGVVAGRERLALYAHGLMTNPSNAGRRTVSAMASSAWAEFL